jgi:transcriptional regulator with XRE-family HTH domain
VQLSFTVRAVTESFVEAFAKAARRAREEAGVTREEIAVALGQSAEKVRFFETGRTFRALDDLISAYEDKADTSLIDLLDEAKATLKKNG